MRYTVVGHTSNSWLVQVTQDKLEMAIVGKPQTPTTLSGTEIQICNEFKTWIGRQENKLHLVFLVKPSGISLFESVREISTDEDVPIGFDLIGEDVMVVDPKTGAE